MRLNEYFRHAFRGMRRQPVRSVLTIIAMAISATIVVSLTSISFGLQQSARQTLSPGSELTNVIVTSNKTTDSSGLFGAAQEVGKDAKPLTDEVVKQLQGLPGVAAVMPTAGIWEFHSFTVNGTDKTFVAQAAGVAPAPGFTKPVIAGKPIAPNDGGHNVVLGYAYAKELGYADNPAALVGKTVTIKTQKGYIGEGAKPDADGVTKLEATIAGVTERGSDETRLFVPMQWARQARTQHFAKGRTEDQIAKTGYSSIIVKAASGGQVQPLVAAINELGFGATSTQELLDKLLQFSTVVWVGLSAIALVALIAASLGVVNTMLMAVTEQRYIIGVWRACGATKGVIARMFLYEAALLGLLGGLIGACLSLGITSLANQQVALLLKAQNLDVVSITFMPWWLLAGGVVLTVIFGVLAGSYPAYRAAKQDPARALTAS